MPGWTAIAAALVLLIGLPGTSGTIVPQKGVGGANVGMSPEQVRAKLGKPVKERSGRNDFGVWLEYLYPGRRVNFQGGQVLTAITTTAPGDRTRTGVGVGSTEKAVRAGVPRVRCRTDLGARHCFVGEFRPGRRVTDFFFQGDQVAFVTVGVVLD